MPTLRRWLPSASCLGSCCIILASSTIAILSFHPLIDNVEAFAPSNSEMKVHRVAVPPHSLHNNHHKTYNYYQYQRTKPPITATTAIQLGVEDIIFNAPNVGSSLANTVIPSATTTSTGAATTSSTFESIKSILILYTAGLWTSFSPCSLGLLPITVSYITNAANERNDKNTILPTLAFASGLALVFTALGVSASALGGVFGGSSGSGTTDPLASLLLAAISSCISVLMGLQLLELINLPLPSLDGKWRSTATSAFQSSASNVGVGVSNNNNSGSLFDENGGLLLDNLQKSNTNNNINGVDDNIDDVNEEEDIETTKNEIASLIRTFLLGGTRALVASPCATPVLASLLAYLASMNSDASTISGDVAKGASMMLSYTFGYSTPLLAVGATGGQALVNLQKATRNNESGDGFNLGAMLGQWVTPLTGGVLIAFGMNGFLVALLGDPSLSALAPIIE